MKYFFLISLMFLILSCNDKEHFSKEVINEMALPYENYTKSNAVDKIPPIPDLSLKFVLTDSTQLCLTYLSYLYNLYIQKYYLSYKKFSTFLGEVLNRKMVIPKDELGEYTGYFFTVNEVVESEYMNEGVDYFLTNYCEVIGKEYEIIRKSMDEDRFYTILFYFYLNNYNIYSRDGFFYIRKN